MKSFMMNSSSEGSGQFDDKAIATDMLISGKNAANMYLDATIESPTPELRAMFSNNLNQIVASHSALTTLACKRKWQKPYAEPTQQLTEAFKTAEAVVSERSNRNDNSDRGDRS